MLQNLATTLRRTCAAGVAQPEDEIFGHVDMPHSEAAAPEVLPLLLAWVQQRATGRAV